MNKAWPSDNLTSSVWLSILNHWFEIHWWIHILTDRCMGWRAAYNVWHSMQCRNDVHICNSLEPNNTKISLLLQGRNTITKYHCNDKYIKFTNSNCMAYFCIAYRRRKTEYHINDSPSGNLYIHQIHLLQVHGTVWLSKNCDFTVPFEKKT